MQLLRRTAKGFLYNKDEPIPLAISEVEAEELVRDSMKTGFEIVLPTIHTEYCPGPSGGSQRLEETARQMTKYMDKYLLEFVPTVVPEDETMAHLMTFENTAYLPLIDQWSSWTWKEDYFLSWNEALKQICFTYFQYAC